MTNEFSVIGEHKEDDTHLLVLGDDGQHYDYSLDREQLLPIEPDDSWAIDTQADEGIDTYEPELS